MRRLVPIVGLLAALTLLMPPNRIGAQAPANARSAAQSRGPENRAEAFNRIEARLKTQERVPVIVQLSAPPAPSPAAPDDPAQVQRLQNIQAPVAALVSSALRATVRPYPLLPFVAMTVDRETLERLKGSPAVVSVAEDVKFGVNLINSQQLVGAIAAWQRGHQGQGWTIAIIDSGVERSHPFFAGRIVGEACFSGRNGCPGNFRTGVGAATPRYGCPLDVQCFHGTYVAGIAAGNGGSASVGFNGMALNASIMPIRLEGLETGDSPASDVDHALQYVYANRHTYSIGAVNMSLGQGGYTAFCDDFYPGTKQAIDLLRAAGIPTVISTGNALPGQGGYYNAINGPSCISSAVSVSSTINAGEPFTDTLAHSAHVAPFVSLVAPGEHIYSSDLNGGFRLDSGTSAAAPHVAGAMALLRAVSPASPVSDLVDVLRSTGKRIVDSLTGASYYRIQIDRAVAQFAPAGELQTIPFNYNGDFWKDILLYNRSTGSWTIKTQDFATTQFIDGPSGGWAPGWDVYIANFNGDNRDDFFLYNPLTGVWFKVMNNITSFTYFSQGWQPGFQIFPATFNFDSRTDFFLYNPNSGVWYTATSTGDGTGGFTYRTGQWAANWIVRTANFNIDGRTDLFLYSRVSGLHYKVITQADGAFSYTGVGVWALTWTPYVGDFDGNGMSDVFLYDSNSGLHYRCFSYGDGTTDFHYTVGQWAPGWSLHVVNHDAIYEVSDLFLFNQSSGVWYKVTFNITGNFTISPPGTWATSWRIIPSDFNLDLRSDMFLYNPASRVWYWAMNSGSAFTYVSGRFY